MSDSAPPIGVPTRRSGGIDGKWEALTSERDELRVQTGSQRERIDELEVQLAAAQRHLEELHVQDSERRLLERVDELEKEVTELRATPASSLVRPSEDEQEAMDALGTAMGIIINRWKLRRNVGEIVAAGHVLQAAIQQHMLSRLVPERWASWWQQPERKET